MQDQKQNTKPTSDPVVNFMKQTVIEKYGEEVDKNFLNEETNRIYEDFGDNLFTHFKPMISAEQKVKLDKLLTKTQNQEEVLGFLMESIDNFEQKIIEYLIEYRKAYRIAKDSSGKN